MTLKNLIKSKNNALTNDAAWVVIYKINTSWNCAVFYPQNGSYEDGLDFDEDDLNEMRKIAKTDSKAICINNAIHKLSGDFKSNQLKNAALEDKIRTMYVLRHCQLNGDFLGSIVPLF